MSSSMKFVRHPSFPIDNCFFTGSGWFWKMVVREWAFAQLDITDVEDGLQATSNNPTIVPGVFEQGPKRITSTRAAGAQKVTVRFYANAAGFTFVHLFDKDPVLAAQDIRIQVEVQTRRAASAADVTLTQLGGKTVAINAPDAKAYEMDKTVVYTNATTPLTLFDEVPNGTNHVVLASHGIEVNDKICMFIGGATAPSLRLDVDNCEEVFAKLKGKMADNGVVWLGGCTIGSNQEFLKKAAKASGCPVVAPVMVLQKKSFPKGHIDMLDGVGIPLVFGPEGKPISLTDFCGRQDTHQFTVPV